MTDLRHEETMPEQTSFAEALAYETRVMENLIETLREQRSAVAQDDLNGIDAATFRVHRLLQRITAATKQRGPRRPKEDDTRAIQAWHTLQQTAHTLNGEIEISRRVLREALATNDEYARSVFGSTPSEPATTPPLINRTV